MKPFADRRAAGRQLARLLQSYNGRAEVLVLGVPRGGVPVAFEVARALDAPLDVMIVRKIGAPGQPEYALGALASGNVLVLNEDAPQELAGSPAVERIVAREKEELARREQTYRAGREKLSLRDRIVILVDDGAATGSSMLAAVKAVKQLGAREVVVALPVASTDACDKLALEADRVVCAETPAVFAAVGLWYLRFPQTSDDEVCALLASATGKAS